MDSALSYHTVWYDNADANDGCRDGMVADLHVRRSYQVGTDRRDRATQRKPDQPPRYARWSVAMSIFFICSMACMARWDFSGSGSLIISFMAVGMICQDTPYLSFSQPQSPSSPPSLSFSQKSSTSSCDAQLTI